MWNTEIEICADLQRRVLHKELLKAAVMLRGGDMEKMTIFMFLEQADHAG